ncbi:hypothetical protein ACWOAH_07850 [Vagococcus vulneris]|uniref:Uncharacterized protein n=1 Tax=Vagococcus vulneris TaxID=1977869 RepID=A0A429ZXT1_9ENTE|nr:hypothetical protein [Vagococcus vulneris]RST98705.1 hypothetical protein CBF37_06540 [Vagococcus vulneris]
MKKQLFLSIWGDVVGLKDLILSISVSILFTMGGYSIAPHDNQTLQLFFGLGGSVIGFIINTIMIKPKRKITVTNRAGGSIDG